jgi:membrane protease YdiL (CAAX protease family)
MNNSAKYCAFTFASSWSFWLLAPHCRTSLTFAIAGWDVAVPYRTILVFAGIAMPALGGLLLRKNLLSVVFKVRLVQARFFLLLCLSAALLPVAMHGVMLALGGVPLNSLYPLWGGALGRLFLLNLCLGPLWEEVGWRGFLLPTLMAEYGAQRGMMLLGLVWGFWHLVLYLAVWKVALLSFTVSFLILNGLSLILAGYFLAANATVWAATIFHAAFNAAASISTSIKPGYGAISSAVNVSVVWITAFILWRVLRSKAINLGDCSVAE